MSYLEKDIRRLFARSMNQCAMPKCTAPIVIGDTIVGEVCHIRAKRKAGPRYDPVLDAKERDAYPNLLLLCRTCHKRVDSEKETYTVGLLEDIKTIQEREGGNDLTTTAAEQAKALFNHLTAKISRNVSAKAGDASIALAIGGDVRAPITINQNPKGSPASAKSKFPANSIGADANMAGYIEYLVDLANKYWANTTMSPGRIGRKIKKEFRIGAKRTRLHVPVDQFSKMVEFLVGELLLPSPAGKRHQRQSTRLCATFEEYRAGR